MSLVDDLLAVLDSPERARSLFTVRAAISLARFGLSPRSLALCLMCSYCRSRLGLDPRGDRKSTRLNSSHGYISYAVFCLKKKNTVSKPRIGRDHPRAYCT